MGDRVEVRVALEGTAAAWHAGQVVRVEPYTQHRSFVWVKLDRGGEISVLNPRRIRRERGEPDGV